MNRGNLVDRRIPAMLSALVVVGLVGCKRPPEAPTKLDELCAYLFEHLEDDSEFTEVGVANMAAWFDNHLEETSEGYEVNTLSEDAVDALDKKNRSAKALIGAAVSTESPHSAEDLVHALVRADQTKIFPKTYASFERTFVTKSQCFVKGTCDRVEFDNHAVSTLPLGITYTADSTGQFLWVETEDGPALVSRSWMHTPADISVDWLRIEAQFYLSVTIPDGKGAIRLQATWVEGEMLAGGMPEASALNMLIDSFRKNDEDLYAWVEDH